MMLNYDYSKLYYAGAILVAIGAFLGRSLFKLIKWIKNEGESLKKDREKLHIVFQELTPNHGSSIKDAVNSLKTDVECVKKDVKKNNEMTEILAAQQNWVLEHQKMPTFKSDSDGMCVWVSENYAQLFGRSPYYFMGNGWKNVIFPEDRERVEQHWNKCVNDKIDAEDIFRTTSSTNKIIKIKVVANRIENGTYIGTISILNCEDPENCKCQSNEICSKKVVI
jgi:PAS domain-containing protein